MTPEQVELLNQRVLADLQRSTDQRCIIALDVAGAMSLISQIQLAARHPSNSGISAGVGRSIVEELVRRLAQLELDGLVEIARLGWHPENDGKLSARNAHPNPSRN